jgi:hypothetical protein
MDDLSYSLLFTAYKKMDKLDDALELVNKWIQFLP